MYKVWQHRRIDRIKTEGCADVRILITGGTGLLGNNLIRLALDRNFSVATLCRSDRNNRAFQGLDVDVYSVDLTDPVGLPQALDQHFDAVIHCAAHIHIGWTQGDEGMRINRDGTLSLLDACSRKSCRFIHVSTVNTLPIGSQEQTTDEQSIGDGQVPCTYVLTKRAAEKAAVDAANRGQDVVIVHPGFMLGPWDWKPSSGRMIQGLNHFAPLAPSGGCSVGDPRDVAEAILNAIDRGRPGRHYILGGENLTYLELWRRISIALGKRGPITYMRPPARYIGSFVGDMMGWLTGKEPDINSAAIRMSSQFHWYSSQRAIEELGYKIRSVDDSIGDAVRWLRSQQLIK
jgi:dihydroflavonol-4-reductase